MDQELKQYLDWKFAAPDQKFIALNFRLSAGIEPLKTSFWLLRAPETTTNSHAGN